jgi:transcriptional regulator with GAF, ATPase, and Fis domain
MLKRHSWPGNIRELKNVIERSVILSTGNRINLDLTLNPANIEEQPQIKIQPEPGEFMTDAEIREIEKSNMISALRNAKWQVWGEGGAAQLLGIKPSTLNYRMKGFGIRKEKYQ